MAGFAVIATGDMVAVLAHGRTAIVTAKAGTVDFGVIYPDYG